MKIKLTKEFKYKLKRQIDFIALDKPQVAKNFNKLIFQKIEEISEMPYKCRKSIFFENEFICDLIVKGYIILYLINELENTIEVFGLHKWEK
jgi:plasmid stabilization system protein ParE